MAALCFQPLLTHPCFVLPLVAEHSAGFQILLVAAVATGLTVICMAAIVAVVLAIKVMTLAASLRHGHHTPATLALSGPLSVQRET